MSGSDRKAEREQLSLQLAVEHLGEHHGAQAFADIHAHVSPETNITKPDLLRLLRRSPAIVSDGLASKLFFRLPVGGGEAEEQQMLLDGGGGGDFDDELDVGGADSDAGASDSADVGADADADVAAAARASAPVAGGSGDDDDCLGYGSDYEEEYQDALEAEEQRMLLDGGLDVGGADSDSDASDSAGPVPTMVRFDAPYSFHSRASGETHEIDLNTGHEARLGDFTVEVRPGGEAFQENTWFGAYDIENVPAHKRQLDQDQNIDVFLCSFETGATAKSIKQNYGIAALSEAQFGLLDSGDLVYLLYQPDGYDSDASSDSGDGSTDGEDSGAEFASGMSKKRHRYDIYPDGFYHGTVVVGS
jgi:hypothetical protein